MIYKTLTLQLYRPSGRKRALLDRALLRYSQALQALMDRYRGEVEELARSEERVTQQALLGLIDRRTSDGLNRFGVQPFKDSLKIEFASLAAAYIGQKRASGGAGYPLTFLDFSRYDSAARDCIRRFDGGRLGDGEFRKEFSKLICRAGNLHPLYFGRYAANRDYCLLYDEFKDRFYAKLYLMNLGDARRGGGITSGLSLRYVTAGMPPLIAKTGKRRYIVAPLAFGREQHEALKRALRDPGLLHTARLVKKGERYYLMVNLACGPEPALRAATTMGVARSAFGGLSYTVCDGGGAVLENGRIPGRGGGEQMIYALAKAVAETALKNRSQVILEANGGKNDRIPLPQNAPGCLTCGQYALLGRILRYKLPERGLPQPVEVSPNGLFFTCPRCQNTTGRNKISEELFACVACGYAAEFEWIGSENLARRLIKYRRDKVPITVSKQEDALLFRNDSLDFEYSLPRGAGDYGPVYDALGRYLQSLDGTFQSDLKKYALLKKLRQSRDLSKAVRLVFRG